MKVSRGILDDYGLDEEGVDEDGGELVHPGDGVGRDRAIYQMILCQVALVKGCGSHYTSVGKKRLLSPPSKMEI